MELYITHEKEMIEQAIEALKMNAGLDIQIECFEPTRFDLRADAFLNIVFNNQKYHFVVEVKNVDRFATVAQVKHHLEYFNQEPLLIAPRLTEAAAARCKELKLNFIDLAGNAYINQPNFFIMIKGQKVAANPRNADYGKRNSNAVTPTNLKMVFVVLCKPEMLNASYRELAQAAGIALGTVGWGLNDLADRGFTLGDGKKNNRVLVQQEKLVREWVTNYPIKLRPKLNVKKFRANNYEWWKNIDILKYQAQWGGEVAAQKLTNYLKPKECTIYLSRKDFRKNMQQLIIENRLVPDINGDVEILEAFWSQDEDTTLAETVPELLVYADLIATNDPRNLEAAKIIYDRLILK